jgi:hypothetical protein
MPEKILYTHLKISRPDEKPGLPNFRISRASITSLIIQAPGFMDND